MASGREIIPCFAMLATRGMVYAYMTSREAAEAEILRQLMVREVT